MLEEYWWRPCASHSLPQLSASLLMPKRSYFRSKSRRMRTYRRGRFARSNYAAVRNTPFLCKNGLNTNLVTFSFVDSI